MNLNAIFVLCLVLVVRVDSKKKHSSSSHTRRSKISPAMPSLGDSPESNAEEAVSTNDDDDNGTGSVDGHQNHQKGANKRGKISSENAANFGNNVVVKAGINPSAAFMVKEENHKGFQGRDKVVHQKSKKKDNKKKEQQSKKSKHSKDHDMMSRLKKIAKEIADVEHKKEEKAALEAKNNKKKGQQGKSISTLDKDISTENSHGRSKATLLSDKPNVEAFQCPWSCFWTCSAYCPAECCNNPYKCPISCKTICAPQCKDKCCAPGAKKLPKLKLPLIQPVRNVAPQNPTFTSTRNNADSVRPLSTFPQFTSYGRDLSEKIKILKEQSNYAANLLQGFSANCPALCSKVCTPIICRRSCCRSSSPQQQSQLPASQYAPVASQRTVYPFYQQSQQQQRDFCPPICSSSCIEQCPNNCCTNTPAPYL